MSVRKPAVLKRSRLTAAMLAAILMPAAASALAQDTEESSSQNSQTEATNLGKVVVTGSLIPQTELETFAPVTIITAEDIRARGFNTISDVLQKSTFATGAVQGAQTLKHNGYKVPLMRNLVKRAVRGSEGGAWTS